MGPRHERTPKCCATSRCVRRAVLAGLACGTVSFLIWGLAPSGKLALLAIPFGAFMGLYGPAAQGIMSHRVDPGEQGQLQGALSSMMGICGMIAPPIFTSVGREAINRPNDVFVIQALLNQRLPKPHAALPVTGKLDVGTVLAIDADPDAPVFDLQIHPTQRLLRATTHGRGLFEYPLDPAP